MKLVGCWWTGRQSLSQIQFIDDWTSLLILLPLTWFILRCSTNWEKAGAVYGIIDNSLSLVYSATDSELLRTSPVDFSSREHLMVPKPRSQALRQVLRSLTLDRFTKSQIWSFDLKILSNWLIDFRFRNLAKSKRSACFREWFQNCFCSASLLALQKLLNVKLMVTGRK